MIKKEYPDLIKNVKLWDGSLKTIKFYEECNDVFLLPRYYKNGYNNKVNIVVGKDIDAFSVKVQPRTDRQLRAIEYMVNNKSGVLELEPGAGKTVISIIALSNILKKTIIMTHKNSLIDQWFNEFVNKTDINPERIGKLNSNNFINCLKEKDIILTTHQTLISLIKKYGICYMRDVFLNSNFGVMIVDECHVGVGPEKFSLASLVITSERTYGLSATPKRFDGLEDIIFYHLGKTIRFDDNEKTDTISPIIYLVEFPFNVYKPNRYFLSSNNNIPLNITRYYNSLSKSDRYIKTVSFLIKKLYNNKRNILVLGKNIMPLLKIAQCVKNFVHDKEDIGLFIPGIFNNKKFYNEVIQIKDIDDISDLSSEFYNRRIVFSTYAAGRDGNNRVDFDALVMTTPTSNIIQAVGRVIRKIDNKRQPIVIDLVDSEGPVYYINNNKMSYFKKLFLNRKYEYDKQGWKVFKINLEKNKK